jgi:3-oxoacyl-[acyl-carrier-protein] synthase II
MSLRRVVITGIGVVTPLGNDLTTFWDRLVGGNGGIRRITHFDATSFDTQIAGEVSGFIPEGYFENPQEARRADRCAQFAVASAKMALADSGIDLDRTDRTRFGVIVGSGMGAPKTLEDAHTVLLNKGASHVSPFIAAMGLLNTPSALISIEHGLEGPNFTIASACATGCNCIGEAWRLIRLEEGEVFLAGGCEAPVSPMGLGGFCALRALSTRNAEPQEASRPFDRDRDGFVIGEGGGVLVVEEYQHARARGARIYCELAGYGLVSDAYHMTSPRPDGAAAARAMRIALQRAEVNISDVDYINAHAASTPIGDVHETNAIKLLAGHHAKHGLLVSSTKSMMGHLLGGAGGVESAACILAIQHGVVPPTINLDHPDPNCDLDYVPHVARKRNTRVVLNNAFGFGGHNVTLCFKAL